MYLHARHCCAFALALALAPLEAQAQSRPVQPQFQPLPLPAAVHPAPNLAPPARETALVALITLADAGFANGFRFANLGGRREMFVRVPKGVTASALVLAIDDVSAHDARRTLEVLVNDRSAIAMALDGHGQGRTVRIPLAKVEPRDGYFKLSFLYSGAATADRCIDARYVGDSLTVMPETTIELDVPATLDVATTATLMPRDIAIVLPERRLSPSDIASALTVARSQIISGRRVTFYRGHDLLSQITSHNEAGRWTQGIILLGTPEETVRLIDSPAEKLAGSPLNFGTLSAVRIAGVPALLVSDANGVRMGGLLASPLLAATRGMAMASIGAIVSAELPADHVTFDDLGVAPAEVEVFGRADMSVAIDMRRLPAGTRPARLLLDVMVAPDGAGEKAVVSTYVSDRFIASAVAATAESTHFDIALPDGLLGTTANIRAVVQRRSAEGDCRFEPQGYPAQILGSSAFVLAKAAGKPHDFSDLMARWALGIDLWIPESAANQPAPVLGLVAEILSALSADSAPIKVSLVAPGKSPAPTGPFLAVSDTAPEGVSPYARFDLGRVVVADRAGHTVLDVGGFASGAVAQLVTAGEHSGLWIKPLAAAGALPLPAELRLEHGDVAFIDATGVTLAMSTERDTLIRISYPDQVSWLTVAERFRTWIIGGLWACATITFLFVLQRLFRRRRSTLNE